jgi:pimeloyl-ACP methyl ester carboxylesterase
VAARAVDDQRLRISLERTIELAEVRLRLRDWPGFAGPLVHVPDPLAASSALVNALAATLAPRYRVLSLSPRGASPYQVDALDLLATLDQFGFERPVLVAEQLGCLTALLVTAWYPQRVAGLVLVDAAALEPQPLHSTETPPSADELLRARALKDCPPDWASLLAAVECPVLELSPHATVVAAVEAFLAQLVPVVT